MKVFTGLWNSIVFSAMALFLAACASSVRQSSTGDYFSYAEALQKEFSKTNNYVCKIYAAADYITYNIPADSQITKKALKGSGFISYQKDYQTESSMGTATLIQEDEKTSVFLSCYHIFNYPDTIINYHRRKDGTKSPFIAHLSVKEKQIHFLKKYNNTQLAEIVAFDKKRDMAFLKALTENDMLSNRLGRLKTLAANQLQTGKEIFITGYPNGYRMVTRGLMSKPFTEQPDKILIDAPFNRGYSGAPFFTLSRECNCFKMAGIITSSASIDKNILVPEFQSHQKTYDPGKIYDDPVYVKMDEQIKYGITYTASVPTIKDFYIENQHLLKNNGINLDDFFKVEE